MPYDEYPCWLCGRLVENTGEPRERVFCEGHLQEYLNEHKLLVQQYAQLKVRVMFETAIRTMEKSGVFMHEYQEAANEVLEVAVTDTEKFMSSYEMIAAIVLYEYGFEFQINHPILQYRVDFFIPELKACLEIDGHLHDNRTIYDNNRDIDIRNHLGSDWEIVRIKTKFIDQDPTKLIDAIEAVHAKKQKLRAENSGIIPDWFSRREKDHYKSILGEKTFKVPKL